MNTNLEASLQRRLELGGDPMFDDPEHPQEGAVTGPVPTSADRESGDSRPETLESVGEKFS